MNIYFTSDPHFHHKRLAELRGFASVEEMNEALIDNWNTTVLPKDEIYVLGDLFFCGVSLSQDILSRLNGRKHWVFGNHDKALRKNPAILSEFVSAQDLKEIKVNDEEAQGGAQRIVLCHFPMLTWNRSHFGSWMLHGHSHGTLNYPHPMRIMDVGVDPNGMRPVSYHKAKAYMADKCYVAVDQHRPKQVNQGEVK